MNRSLVSKPRTRTLERTLRVFVDLMRMFRENGRWWLIPFVLVLALGALLLAGLHAIEYVAPFVYSIF